MSPATIIVAFKAGLPQISNLSLGVSVIPTSSSAPVQLASDPSFQQPATNSGLNGTPNLPQLFPTPQIPAQSISSAAASSPVVSTTAPPQQISAPPLTPIPNPSLTVLTTHTEATGDISTPQLSFEPSQHVTLPVASPLPPTTTTTTSQAAPQTTTIAAPQFTSSFNFNNIPNIPQLQTQLPQVAAATTQQSQES